MMRIVLSTILLASAMIFALAVGCDSGGDGPGEDTTVTPEDTAEAGEPIDFTVAVEGFGMSGNLVPGTTVELFDNDTGESAGVTAVADGDGYVTFEALEKGKQYGFKCTKDNFQVTFVWNLEAQDAVDDNIWIVPNTVFQMALGLAGLSQEAGKSVVAGAVYWLDDDGEEVGIGCATVTSDPATEDIRYMAEGNGLPTTLENQAFTGCADTEGNGRFVAGNLPAGDRVTLTAISDAGDVIGSTTLWSIADAIAVSNIYPDEGVTAMPASPCCE